MMLEIVPNQDDLEAVQEYVDGPAQNYHGMSYAQGIQAMIDWLTGNGNRPDIEE